MSSVAALAERPAAPLEAADSSRNLWAIVLAGGEGLRLKRLTRTVCGDERPKQYAALLDSRSLLRLTLDRVGALVPPERTVIVTKRNHAKYMAPELGADSPPPWVLVQPEDRGTAAGVLLPAQWIHRRDPGATVVVFPSDHFIADERPFIAHLESLAAFVDRQPARCVLLGARPTAPEAEYGWIAPGAAIGEAAGEPVSRVRWFWEKPSAYATRTLFAAGFLWSTFIFVAKTATLLAAGRRCLPTLADRLSTLAPLLGTPDEPWALHQAYRLAPRADFSRAVFQAGAPVLAVSRMPDVGWSDWGTPERVLQSLWAAGISPPWLPAVAASL